MTNILKYLAIKTLLSFFSKCVKQGNILNKTTTVKSHCTKKRLSAAGRKLNWNL